MSLLSISKLSPSAGQGGSEPTRSRPGLPKSLGFLVLPLLLLPPLMLHYAGTHHPEVFPTEVRGRDWAGVAEIFLLAEIATLLVMGWLIKQVSTANGLSIGYRDAYLLAAIAPVPMWLSSLGLVVPNFGFNVALSFVATCISCGLIYRGIEALCHTREDVTAASITQIVIGAGLIAWALLLVVAMS